MRKHIQSRYGAWILSQDEPSYDGPPERSRTHGVQKLADSHSLAIIDKEAATGTTFVAQLTLRNVFYMAKCKHLERMTLFSRSEAQKT
jgi:hypothetical protein